MKKVLFFLLMLFSISDAFSQYYRVPMEDKLEHSISIIEGTVLSKTSFYKNGDILTKNRVQVHKVIKGLFLNNEIEILTFGGTIEGVTLTASHGFSLRKGDKGFFFISKSNLLSDEVGFYEVYAGKQGFYKVKNNGYGENISGFLSEYYGINHFYKEIGIEYDKEQLLIEYAQGKTEYCLDYRIEPIGSNEILNSNQLEFNIYVKANERLKIRKLDLTVYYNSKWFGQEIVSSNNLEVSDGDFNSAFELNVVDFSTNSIKFTINSETTPQEIDSNEEIFMCKIRVNIEKLSTEEPILLNNTLYFVEFIDENGRVESNSCGKIIIEGHKACDPLIESFNVRDGAGAEKILTIIGKRLIHSSANGTKCNIPTTNSVFEHRVKFTDVNGDWISPLFGDYISWSNTKIEVKIPTTCLIGDSNIEAAPEYDEYAATGKIQVCIASSNTNLCDCNDISGGPDDNGKPTQEKLYVPFSTYSSNDLLWQNPNPCYETFHSRLFSTNTGNGIYFNIEKLPVDYQNAFIRALNKWRCATKINFGINNNIGIPVEFNFLGAGRYGETDFLSSPCITDPINGDQNIGAPISVTFDRNRFLTGGFDPGVPNVGSINNLFFEYTALHEIGHCMGLIHTSNPRNLMKKTQVFGDYLISIPLDDLEGGLYCKGRSTLPLDGCAEELVTLNGNCNIQLISTNVVKEQAENSMFYIYPNPTNNMVTIKSNFDVLTCFQIKIYNISGVVLMECEIGEGENSISLENFSSGVYYIKIYSKLSSVTKKIIKI